MSPEQYQRMKRILLGAAEKIGDARQAYLDEACESDMNLRDRIERILGDPDTMTSFLASPVVAEAGAMLESGRIPDQIGPYSVRRLIASGGMGQVYEAEQQNPKRLVALKVIRGELRAPSAHRRFEYEAQVVAGLRHPSIAQVYEAGTYEVNGNSLPYFAMEYVPDARSITRFADEESLSTDQRLELFLHACDAVEHAHQRGVIHRDLKPSNILVDAAGRVYVIDFGVARATEIDRSATLQTQAGQLVGTLQYMSPEQVGADPGDVDTRTDVYALGVILFELLTCETPYDVGSATLFEASRIIREQTPKRLSSFDARWRGDADTIVQTALQKDRETRYPSVSALRQDIWNYLHNASISARPPSLGYQLKMLARRHRGFVTGLVLTMLALAISSVVITRLYFQAKADRQVAQRESINARREVRISAEVNRFLNDDLLASVSPENTPDPDVTMRKVLDIAAKRIEGRFTDEPRVEASVRLALGRTYSKLALYDEAETHMDRAVALMRASDADDAAMFPALTALGELRYRTADYDAADKLLSEALEASRHAWGENDSRTASAMNTLAFLRLQQGRISEARPLMERSIEIARACHGESNPEFVNMLMNLAMLYLAHEEFAEARRVLEDAYATAKKQLGPLHPTTLTCGNSLASVYNDMGRYDEGIALLRSIAESQTRVLGADHPQTLISMNNLGFALMKLDRLDEAEPIIEHVVEARKRVLGETHPHTLASLANLGALRRKQKRYDEAERIYKRNLEVNTETLGADHPETIYCLHDLARLYMVQEDYASAEPIVKEIIARRERLSPTPDIVLGRVYELHGRCLMELNRLAEAEESLLKAEKLLEQLAGPDAQPTQLAIKRLVELYKRWNREASRLAWEQRLKQPLDQPREK